MSDEISYTYHSDTHMVVSLNMDTYVKYDNLFKYVNAVWDENTQAWIITNKGVVLLKKFIEMSSEKKHKTYRRSRSPVRTVPDLKTSDLLSDEEEDDVV